MRSTRRACPTCWAATVLGASIGFGLVAPGPLLAQDQVIVDPELEGEPLQSGGGAGEEMVIQDPELAGEPPAGSGTGDNYGWGDVYQPPGQEAGAEDEDEYDPMANTGLASLEVAAQFAFDIHHEGADEVALALEDAYESRFRFGGEVEFRRSRNLRLMLGTRLDLLWAVPSHNDAWVKSPYSQGQRALDQDRFELDVLPTAAYVDWTMFPGGHLRVGHQVVTFGRMDIFSGTDILAVYDLRPQPTLNPAAINLAQPAVRFDWDITTAITLKLAYVPWFTPNLMRPDRDKFKATVIGGPGLSAASTDLVDVIPPSFQTQSAQANFRFLGPVPDFTTPQGQARLDFRAPNAAFALTGGTALEKIPAFYYVPAVESFALCNPYVGPEAQPDACSDELEDVAALLAEGVTPVSAVYHRYYLVGTDLAFNAGPLSMVIEAAFSPERYLYAASEDGSRLPIPNTTEPITDYEVVGEDGERESNVTDESIRQGVPVIQGGLHVEYLRGQNLIIAGEFFYAQTTRLPHDRSRQWLGFKPGLGAAFGGAIIASYLVNNGDWRFDVTAMSTNGPSVAVIPQIEFRAAEGFYLNVGAQLIDGPNPGFNGSSKLNFGGLFGGSDQVFVGLRWLP